MNEDINVRIQSLIKEKALNAAQFADTIGVQRSSVSHILSGRNKPSIDFIEKLLIHYKDVDIYWLITGNISNKEKVQSIESNNLQLNVVNSDISSRDASLFDIPQLPKVQKKKIERIVTFYSDRTFTDYYPE